MIIFVANFIQRVSGGFLLCWLPIAAVVYLANIVIDDHGDSWKALGLVAVYVIVSLPKTSFRRLAVVAVVQSAQDRTRYDRSFALDGAAAG